jgi:transketolase
MRTAFFNALMAAAEKDDRINLMVGDLGFGVVEPFERRFPDRFINAGVAEQNMTGMAAGLALCGKIVFTYSIANFPTLRCLEQIRNDVCYHNANVKIVAVGGGFCYGSLGMTHHATEDLAILRSLPNMTVVAPGDPAETEKAVHALVNTPGPCYLRLGRAGEPDVHTEPFDFELGKAITMRQGADVTLLSTGGMLQTTVQAADRLAAEGITARILSMPTLKPLDCTAILAAAQETRSMLTIEEHSVIGGLGSAVSETLAESGIAIPFRRIGLASEFSCRAGSQEYLQQMHGLTPTHIAAAARELLAR